MNVYINGAAVCFVVCTVTQQRAAAGAAVVKMPRGFVFDPSTIGAALLVDIDGAAVFSGVVDSWDCSTHEIKASEPRADIIEQNAAAILAALTGAGAVFPSEYVTKQESDAEKIEAAAAGFFGDVVTAGGGWTLAKYSDAAAGVLRGCYCDNYTRETAGANVTLSINLPRLWERVDAGKTWNYSDGGAGIVCTIWASGRAPNAQEIKTALNSGNWIPRGLTVEGMPQQGWYDCDGVATYWSTTPAEKYENYTDDIAEDDRNWYVQSFSVDLVRRWIQDVEFIYNFYIKDAAAGDVLADVDGGALNYSSDLIGALADKWRNNKDNKTITNSERAGLEFVNYGSASTVAIGAPDMSIISKDVNYIKQRAAKDVISSRAGVVLTYGRAGAVDIAKNYTLTDGRRVFIDSVTYTASGGRVTAEITAKDAAADFVDNCNILAAINAARSVEFTSENINSNFSNYEIPAGASIIEDRPQDYDGAGGVSVNNYFYLFDIMGFIRKNTGYSLKGFNILRPYCFMCSFADIEQENTEKTTVNI